MWPSSPGRCARTRRSSALRVSIGGQPVPLPGGVERGQRRPGRGVRPGRLPGQLAALRAARRAAGLRDRPTALDAGRRAVRRERPTALRVVAVNLDATQVAGRHRTAARSLLAAPVAATGRADVAPGGQRRHRPAAARPGTSPTGSGWSTGRRRGAGVSVRRAATARTPCGVPGVTGRTVPQLPGLPRRLPARGRGRTAAAATRIVVSRIRHDDQGRVLGATPAQRIAWEGAGTAPDPRHRLAARRPRSRCCTRSTGELSQVRTIAVDGSPPGLDSLSTTLARPGAGAGRLAGRRPRACTPSRGPA